jgi:NDP-sugar pyrophosphorylase family protein
MNDTKTGFEHLKTTELFNLTPIKNDIPIALAEFLHEATFPWEALGKKLSEFLTGLIQNIPKNQRLRGNISPHAVIDENSLVVIEEGATVEAHAYISGPTYIAAGATIRHAAYVRGSVFVCHGAVIGHTSEAKGSILLPHAKAAHFAYVGDSILGRNCNLGAGTKLANLRFDSALIKLREGKEFYPTGLKKMGAIMGDNAQTGCNSVTNPGTLLLPNAILLPNTTGRGILRPQKAN